MLGESWPSLEVNDRGIQGNRLFAIRDQQDKFGSSKNTRRFRKVDRIVDKFDVRSPIPHPLIQDPPCVSLSPPLLIPYSRHISIIFYIMLII